MTRFPDDTEYDIGSVMCDEICLDNLTIDCIAEYVFKAAPVGLRPTIMRALGNSYQEGDTANEWPVNVMATNTRGIETKVTLQKKDGQLCLQGLITPVTGTLIAARGVTIKNLPNTVANAIQEGDPIEKHVKVEALEGRKVECVTGLLKGAYRVIIMNPVEPREWNEAMPDWEKRT